MHIHTGVDKHIYRHTMHMCTYTHMYMCTHMQAHTHTHTAHRWAHYEEAAGSTAV